jgi:hypothetical protein
MSLSSSLGILLATNTATTRGGESWVEKKQKVQSVTTPRNKTSQKARDGKCSSTCLRLGKTVCLLEPAFHQTKTPAICSESLHVFDVKKRSTV